MSKRRKTSQEQEKASAERASRTEVAPLESNRAVADAIAGTERTAPELELETVRDVAFPLVERASLALHLEPRPAADLERMIHILERSHFDRSHKDALIDKLEGDQAAALAVQATAERTLGDLEDGLRSEIIDVLDRVWTALSEGQGTDNEWSWDGRAFSLGELEGSAADRASTLIETLVDGLGSDAMKEGLADQGAGASVARFCRSVVLAKAFDEEEEEDVGYGEIAAPEES